MLSTARQLRDLLRGEPPGRWIVLGLLVLVATVLEAAAAGLVFLLVDLMSTGSTSLAFVGTISTDDGNVLPLTVGVTALFVVRALVVVMQQNVLFRICYGAGADVEERLLRAYLALSPRELRRRGQGELVRNVHDTVMLVVEGALIPLVMSVGLALRVLGIGAVMVWAAPVPSAVAVVVFAPALWVISRWLRSPARRLGEEVERSLAESLKVATETLNLATELRTAGRSDDFSRRFGVVRRRLARAAGVEEVLGVLPRLIAETLLVFFVVAFIALSMARAEAGAALPTLGLFAYSALRLLPSVVEVVGLVQSVRHTGPALESLSSDRPLMEAVASRASTTGRRKAPTAITLRDVTVQHDDAANPALQGVDLELRRGDVVAVIGHNGSGKSTLVDLITGQVTPSSGSVLLDGEPLADVGDRWLEHVGLVAQHVKLLDENLMTNVTLALPGTDRDDEKAQRILRLLGAGDLDSRLPGGEGSALGEDGRLLSGGERQKVALARALYRDVALLVMDEGTSALDTEARDAVLAAIMEGSRDRITLVVTHDPVAAASCTRVLRLTAGRLVEEHPASAGPVVPRQSARQGSSSSVAQQPARLGPVP